MDYKYAYLFGVLLLGLPLWLFFFIRRKDLRREMLLLSFLFGLVGPISEFWYLQDYWNPQTITGWKIGIEDFLFGFFFGGISCVVYEELFAKKYSNRRTRKRHWAFLAILIDLIGLIIFNFLFFFLGINSIYASIAMMVFIGALIIILRKDLLTDALISGVFCGILFLVFYLVFTKFYPEIFSRFWQLHNISGITIATVPLEEILWAISAGIFIGPLYEFWTGLRFK